MTKDLVTRTELARIIARELADVDVPDGTVGPGPHEEDILGEGDDWFMKPAPPTQEIKAVIERLKTKYELRD